MTVAQPLVSIVTVVRNAAHALAPTIDSVLREKTSEVEYLVVDGLSTDGTLDVARRYAHAIDVLISERDAGLYDAMNKGAAAARGRWLLFLNAGDTLRPGMLAALLARAEQLEGPADVVAGRVEMVDSEGRPLGYRHPNRVGDAGRLLRENCVAHQATLMARTLFGRHGGFSLDYRIMGDYEYWIRLLRAGVQIRFVPDVVVDFAATGISSQRASVPLAERERLDILRRHGYLSRTGCALRWTAARSAYALKSVARRLVGARMSRAISLLRSRRA